MLDMAKASAAAGMSLICFTDHCDMVNWRDFKLTDRGVSVFPRMLEEYGRAKASGLPIEVRLGLELGESHYNPALAKRLASQPGVDFIIGSLHILEGLGDFCWLEYKNEDDCHRLFKLYLDELIALAERDCFDVMGHIGYPRRYMVQRGVDADMSLARYHGGLERLLKTIISNGRGIEVNCSGIRDGCGPFPNPETIRFYRELGGEIITIGSDAHRTSDAGKCIREGMDILRECGFSRVTVFRGRKPEFIDI